MEGTCTCSSLAAGTVLMVAASVPGAKPAVVTREQLQVLRAIRGPVGMSGKG